MEYFSNFIWEKGKESCSRVSLVLQHVLVRKKAVLLACVCESDNAGEIGVTESGYFTEGLIEWFHRGFLKQCERKITENEVEKLLQQEIPRLEKDIRRFDEKKGIEEALHYWGILLWENHFWIFQRGKCEGYLVNKRFQRKHLKRLGVYGENAVIPTVCPMSVEMERMKEYGAVLEENTDTMIPAQKWQSAICGDNTELFRQNRLQSEWLSGDIQRGVGILLCTSDFISCMEPEEVVEVLDLEGNISEQRIKRRLQELGEENVRRGATRSVGAIYLRT